MGWDYKEDWEGKTDIKGFSSVRAALQDEWYRCTALRRDWTRKRCIEAWIRKKSPLSVFKLRTNCAPKVREEIWLTDIHIKRNRRSSSSRARNGKPKQHLLPFSIQRKVPSLIRPLFSFIWSGFLRRNWKKTVAKRLNLSEVFLVHYNLILFRIGE